ncbi:MAG: hypothetical protein JWM10_3029 [Myxococcaceae bacterium]|nr:hypothetical protein [Myxococcaceae bacterium]
MLTLDERARAAAILLNRDDLTPLGAGLEGVVLTDGARLFKVFDGWPTELREARRRALASWAGRFEDCRHLQPLLAVEEVGGIPVLVQEYFPSTVWVGEERAGVVGFLRECLREAVAYDCFNPSNFRVVAGHLRLTDYGADLRPFSWTAWVYMARRAWISMRRTERSDLKAVLRASITDWELPELDGFGPFLIEVLDGAAGPSTSRPGQRHALPGVPAPDVTLLIKVCYQEGDTLLWMVRHLVRQLEGPRRFAERRVVLDARRDDYPRQYSAPNVDAAHAALDTLVGEGTVDRVEVAPVDGPSVRAVYQRWFGLEVDHPASLSGVPVAPQLWAFDQVPTRYVLQVDADAIVGRRDRAHDYLHELKTALQNSPDAIAVGFQIAHPEGWSAPYDAPRGGHCPEVRCGLLDLERLRALHPLPNEVCQGRVALTWYRAVERAQRERGLRSLRGGDARSFYVHPPNARKIDRGAWFDVVDRVEQGLAPPGQFGRVDLTCTPEEWAIPSLRHEHIFVVVVDEASRGLFPRLWASLMAQSRRDWGAVVVDPTFDSTIEDVARGASDRVALVRNRALQGARLVRHAIARHVREPDALVVPLRADDELLGGSALTMIRRRAVAGHRVIEAPVLEGMRLRVAPVAARIAELGTAEDADPIAALLAGLRRAPHDPAPGPLLRRERPVSVIGGGPAPQWEAACRPAPVGQLVRGQRWRAGGDDVLFLRHAEKAGGSRFCSVEENRGRPLSLDGLDEARALGHALRPAPDVIVCAPIVRARQTAEQLAAAAGTPVAIVEDQVLLGGRFEDHARWLAMKRDLGWEALVERWLRGDVAREVVEPAAEAIPALLRAVRRHVVGARRALVITQGYVNTALFRHAEGRLDFSGGALYGFWLPREHRAWRDA